MDFDEPTDEMSNDEMSYDKTMINSIIGTMISLKRVNNIGGNQNDEYFSQFEDILSKRNLPKPVDKFDLTNIDDFNFDESVLMWRADLQADIANLFLKIITLEVDFFDEKKLCKMLMVILKYNMIINVGERLKPKIAELIKFDKTTEFIVDINEAEKIIILLLKIYKPDSESYEPFLYYLLDKFDWSKRLSHFLSVAICKSRIEIIENLLKLTTDLDEDYYELSRSDYEIIHSLWKIIPDPEKVARFLVKCLSWRNKTLGSKIKVIDDAKIYQKIFENLTLDQIEKLAN